MKVIDRLHEGKLARFVTVKCSDGRVREIGYLTGNYSNDQIPRLDKALLTSMQFTLERDNVTEVDE